MVLKIIIFKILPLYVVSLRKSYLIELLFNLLSQIITVSTIKLTSQPVSITLTFFVQSPTWVDMMGYC